MSELCIKNSRPATTFTLRIYGPLGTMTANNSSAGVKFTCLCSKCRK